MLDQLLWLHRNESVSYVAYRGVPAVFMSGRAGSHGRHLLETSVTRTRPFDAAIRLTLTT